MLIPILTFAFGVAFGAVGYKAFYDKSDVETPGNIRKGNYKPDDERKH